MQHRGRATRERAPADARCACECVRTRQGQGADARLRQATSSRDHATKGRVSIAATRRQGSAAKRNVAATRYSTNGFSKAIQIPSRAAHHSHCCAVVQDTGHAAL